jgi:hypothetical protein
MLLPFAFTKSAMSNGYVRLLPSNHGHCGLQTIE